MTAWVQKRFSDPQTSFATTVTIMSTFGAVIGAIGIARILIAMYAH